MIWSVISRSAPALPILGVVYLGLVPTALAFSTWAYALSHTSAGKLGVTTFAVPPITILLGWLLLGEVPPTPGDRGWCTFAGGCRHRQAPCLIARSARADRALESAAPRSA